MAQKRIEFWVIENPPTGYILAIGEIVTAWAIQEWELKRLVYMVLGIDDKRGRTSVRSPRASEMIQMIRELLQIEGVTIDSVDLNELESALGQLESHRNLFAHSIWLEGSDGSIAVQNLQGAWPAEKGWPKVKKRIYPEWTIVQEGDCLKLVHQIRKTTRYTRIAYQQIEEQLLAWRRKHPLQSVCEGSLDHQLVPHERPPPTSRAK